MHKIEFISKHGKLDPLKLLLVVSVVGIFIFNLILNFGLSISKSTGIRGVESYVINTIQQAMVGNPLYTNPEEVPFSISQYNPLYYIIVAEIGNLFNIIPGEQVAKLYLIGRITSFTISLLLTTMIYLIARHFGASLHISIFAAILAYILPTPWHSLARPDALMVFLGVTTITLYSEYLLDINKKHSSLLLIACGCTGFLAFLTKQNGLIFIIPVGMFSLLRLKFRELAFIFGGFILTLIITSLAFSSYYNILPDNGNYFYENIIGGVNNGIAIKWAYQALYSIYFSWYLPCFLFPVAAILYTTFKIKKNGFQSVDQISIFLSLTFFIVTVFSLVIGLKYGSAINYMNESMIIGILLIVRFGIISNLSTEIEKNKIFKNATVIFVVFFLSILTINNLYRYANHLKSIFYYSDYDKEALDFLKNELQKHPDALVFSTIDVIKGVFFENITFPQYQVSKSLHHRNLVDYSDLEILLEQGKMKYFVVRHGSNPPAQIFGYPIGNLVLVEQTPSFDIFLLEQHDENFP